MVYDKKVLSALESVIASLVYEEGLLAIINKYGPFLSDTDKVQATQLITTQRANLDRLFEIVKNDLGPLMGEISKNGENMSLFVGKLISTEVIAKQTVLQQEATDNVVMTGADNGGQMVINSGVTTEVNTGEVSANSAEIVSATDNGGQMVTNSGVTTEANTGEVPDASTEIVSATDNGGQMVINSGVTTEINTREDPAASTESEAVPESTASFVLSPIDEDVAPAASAKEEVKAAEAGKAAAEQQLKAIDDVKNEIKNDAGLTEEAKAAKLEQYTRMTDSVVRAILVSKTQFEKLLASLYSQKTLLSSGDVKNEEGVAVVPDFTAGVVGVGENSASSMETSTNGGEVIDSAVVLPMISGETSNNAENATVSNVVPANNVVLEIPGAVTSSESEPIANPQNELQSMIDKANELYKKGEVAAAQALFEKIGAMNKEMQGGTEEKSDATVFVKK